MTKEEACAAWLRERGGFSTTWQDLWNGACAWQMAQDANLVAAFATVECNLANTIKEQYEYDF